MPRLMLALWILLIILKASGNIDMSWWTVQIPLALLYVFDFLGGDK